MRTSTSKYCQDRAWALRVQLNGSVMAAWVGDEVIRGVRGRGCAPLVTRKRGKHMEVRLSAIQVSSDMRWRSFPAYCNVGTSWSGWTSRSVTSRR